jgi:hypothetical protein
MSDMTVSILVTHLKRMLDDLADLREQNAEQLELIKALEREDAHNAEDSLSIIQLLATAVTGRACPKVTPQNMHAVADEVLATAVEPRVEADAFAEWCDENARCRAIAQKIIDAIGSVGPESAEEAVDRALRMCARVAVLERVRDAAEQVRSDMEPESQQWLELAQALHAAKGPEVGDA